MPYPTSTQTNYAIAKIYTMTTVADSMAYIFPVSFIRWNLTTAATSTWALHVTQSSAVAGSTFGFPLIGHTTAPYFLGGSTAAITNAMVVDFQVNNWVYGLVLSTITAGSISIHKAADGQDWTGEAQRGSAGVERIGIACRGVEWRGNVWQARTGS